VTIESWGDTWYGGLGKKGGTWWPAGRDHVPNGRLKQLLALSARYHSRHAIALFISSERDELLQCAISVGCAVELLAKSYLASIEHGLLAENGERDAILVLANKATLATSGTTDIRTISAMEALRVAKHLHPTLPFNPQMDKLVLKVRNAAAHMAIVRTDELNSAVLLMCRIVESLLSALVLERGDFWGPHALSVVNEIIDKDKSERRRIVTGKLAAAERRLSQLLAGLDEASKTIVLTSLSGRQTSTSDHEEPQECPVCHHQGWLICSVDTGPIESETDEYGHTEAWVERTAYPMIFECPVCSLELHGDELLEMDFPTEIELEPDADPYPDWEPDEDWLRGR
jgi:hypothetical protein